jgi:hypothetical protein
VAGCGRLIEAASNSLQFIGRLYRIIEADGMKTAKTLPDALRYGANKGTQQHG